MAEDRKDNLQDDTAINDDFLIADDAQIADMQREFSALGIGGGRNDSRLCSYPLPVYMTDKCFEICKCAKEMVVILNGLDKMFVSRNQKVIDFLIKSIGKNNVAIALKGNITQEIFLPEQRMPIKQSMYRLLELHNYISIALEELCVYDKSVSMGEVVVRHLLVGSVLHGICI
ncbi:MAG: hypothetical protein K2M75_07815 [Clostridia bacterium]|nr:hypothetical protein [Clostridia bacterium]